MVRSCLRLMNLSLPALLSGKSIGLLGSEQDGKPSADEKCSVMVRLCLYFGEGGMVHGLSYLWAMTKGTKGT